MTQHLLLENIFSLSPFSIIHLSKKMYIHSKGISEEKGRRNQMSFGKAKELGTRSVKRKIRIRIRRLDGEEIWCLRAAVQELKRVELLKFWFY